MNCVCRWIFGAWRVGCGIECCGGGCPIVWLTATSFLAFCGCVFGFGIRFVRVSGSGRHTCASLEDRYSQPCSVTTNCQRWPSGPHQEVLSLEGADAAWSNSTSKLAGVDAWRRVALPTSAWDSVYLGNPLRNLVSIANRLLWFRNPMTSRILVGYWRAYHHYWQHRRGRWRGR